MAPQIWYFTIRAAQVARQLDRMLGERVRLHYTEHKGVPSGCFGDTPYYVDGVTQIGSAVGAPGGTMAPAPMTAAPVPSAPVPSAPAPVVPKPNSPPPQ